MVSDSSGEEAADGKMERVGRKGKSTGSAAWGGDGDVFAGGEVWRGQGQRPEKKAMEAQDHKPTPSAVGQQRLKMASVPLKRVGSRSMD